MRSILRKITIQLSLINILEDEEAIKRIAPFALGGPKSLHNIEFEENSAFMNSSLEKICIPKKVARIDKSAF